MFEGLTLSINNSNSMVRGAFSSHPRCHLPKKRNNDSSQNPTLQTPSSPKHPGTDAGEDPHHQNRANVRMSMLIKPSFHQRSRRTTHKCVFLGSFRHEASTSVSSARRRRHGVGRGQPFTDPSPSTIPHICSPSPALEASCPPPFNLYYDILLHVCPQNYYYCTPVYYYRKINL